MNGASNAVIGYLLFCGCYLLLSRKLHYLVILTIANVLSFILGYWTNRLFVFRSQAAWVPESLRFALIYACCVLLNYGVMILGVSVLGLHPLWAQVAAAVVSASTGFIAHRAITFRARQA